MLRITDQSAASATKAVADLATLTDPDSLAGAVAVLQRGLLRIRHPMTSPNDFESSQLGVPASDK